MLLLIISAYLAVAPKVNDTAVVDVDNLMVGVGVVDNVGASLQVIGCSGDLHGNDVGSDITTDSVSEPVLIMAAGIVEIVSACEEDVILETRDQTEDDLTDSILNADEDSEHDEFIEQLLDMEDASEPDVSADEDGVASMLLTDIGRYITSLHHVKSSRARVALAVERFFLLMKDKNMGKMLASQKAAHVFFEKSKKNSSAARRIRKAAAHFAQTKMLPEDRRGKHQKVTSLLDNADIRTKVNEWIDDLTLLRQGRGSHVSPQVGLLCIAG